MACSRYSWPASMSFRLCSAFTNLSGKRLIMAMKRWQKSTFCFPGSTPAIFTKGSKASASTQLASVNSRSFLANSTELMGSLGVIINFEWLGVFDRGCACLGVIGRNRF